VFPFGVNVTVERSTGTDRFGNPLPADTHTLEGCALAAEGSTELVNGQATVVDQDTLYCDYDADLKPQDVVVVPDGAPIPPGRYQVDGRPQRLQNPYTGWQAGSVARLNRGEG
jgi:hypothetical protein